MRCSKRLFVISLALSATLLTSCSSSNPAAPARVSGKIGYAGKPIKAGALKFHTREGTAYDGLISPDGTYVAQDLPIGEMIVTVETESINPNRVVGAGKQSADNQRRLKMMGKVTQSGPGGAAGDATADAGPKASDNYLKIPEKYGNPKTSPLTVTLDRGRQVHNFELVD